MKSMTLVSFLAGGALLLVMTAVLPDMERPLKPTTSGSSLSIHSTVSSME